MNFLGTLAMLVLLNCCSFSLVTATQSRRTPTMLCSKGIKTQGGLGPKRVHNRDKPKREAHARKNLKPLEQNTNGTMDPARNAIELVGILAIANANRA